jgi:hypothetical protein
MLERIDANLQRPTPAHLDALRKKPLWEIAQGNGDLRTQAEIEHARVIADDGPWWAGHESKEAILRTAYICAVELSLSSGRVKPILTLWVRGLDRFQAAVVETPTEIIVHWLTPDPPASKPPRASTVVPNMAEGIWAVAKDETIDGYVNAFMSGEYADADDPSRIKNPLPGVKAFHVIGY